MRMAENGYIKTENDTQYDTYDAFLSNSIEADSQYFQYENDENESLIEYVEEGEVENENSLEHRIKTHTLSIKRLIINDNHQEVYRCLECAIDFATVDDFTKVHREMQKKQKHISKENEEFESDMLNNEPTVLVHEAQDWMIVKEEDIINEENITDIYEDNAQEYIEMAENTAAIENIENKMEEFVSEADQLAKKSKPTHDILIDDHDDDDGEKYFCCDCQLVFSDLESAEQHVCSALNTDANTNEITSDEKFAEQIGYDSNMQIYLEEQKKKVEANKKSDIQYQCLECDKHFNTLQGLQIHNRSHKSKQLKAKSNTQMIVDTNSTTCPICNTTFSSYKNLKLHMKIHNEQQVRSIEQALPAGAKAQYTDMNKFFCEICNKSFEQHLLGIHKNMHQQTTEYNCGICNRHFENKTSYEMHMQMHADRPTKPRKSQKKATADGSVKNDGRFPCQYCGRTFQRPFEKVRHERVHTGEKPYACEVCGKTFRVPYSLTLHLRTHTDIRPYVCATCNKRFKSQTVYAHHLRTHEPERSYKCEICSKGFRTSVQLSAHRNIHSKPYCCPVCSRPFASLYYVKVHMKTHNKLNRTGDTTKYSCYICGAVYARISALRIHMKDLHLIDMDTNEPLLLDDEIIKDESNALSQQDMEEHYEEEEEEDRDDVEEEDEEHEVDHEAAVLIAAAAEADCAAYIEAATAQSTDARTSPSTSRMGLHAQIDTEYAIMLPNDELIVDNYQTEEVVGDWLAK